MEIKEMMNLKRWAVIGVKPDKRQYANMIYNILKENAYIVYPVNPKYDQIGDDRCYPKVNDIPDKIDVVDMVVSPKIGIDLIDEMSIAGIKYLWLQPGSYDDDIIEKIEKKDFAYVKDCIYARLKLKNQGEK